jgi:hypothetical protein
VKEVDDGLCYHWTTTVGLKISQPENHNGYAKCDIYYTGRDNVRNISISVAHYIISISCLYEVCPKSIRPYFFLGK